jgi:hypothetical protein
MDYKDRDFLRAMVLEIEGRFPSVMAGFDGFTEAFLGGEQDGFLSVEVFNVSEESYEELLGFCEGKAKRHFLNGGAFVVFNLWSEEETHLHFQHIVSRILLQRYRASILGSRYELRRYFDSVVPSPVRITPLEESHCVGGQTFARAA